MSKLKPEAGSFRLNEDNILGSASFKQKPLYQELEKAIPAYEVTPKKDLVKLFTTDLREAGVGRTDARLSPDEVAKLIEQMKGDDPQQRGSRWLRVIKHRERLAKPPLRLSEQAQTELRGNEARDRLVTSLLPISLYWVSNWKGMRQEEIIAVCNLAILENLDRAIKGFDPSDPKKNNLGTYFLRVCKTALMEAKNGANYLVSVSSETLRRRKKAREENIARSESEKETLRAVPKWTASLEKPLGDRNGDETDRTYHDILADPRVVDLEDKIAHEEVKDYIRSIFQKLLTPQEAEVMDLLYLHEPHLEMKEVAKELNQPLSYVANRQHRSLLKLRDLDEQEQGALRAFLKLHITPSRLISTKKGKTRQVLTVPTDPNPKSDIERLYNKKIQKLDAEKVREMRALYKASQANGNPLKLADLAKQFGISLATASSVINRKTWKDVK